ncbi:putative ATP-dependent bile acid permease [Operophtera brumata]|uniref:Putative ATP-dependent bile acid permease n=1 Tax=Operophtera brumata TaxID=104452 RepID=A0A0L7KR45_OPEBR|nr:putative ATP-dependent bile acid permease [Operophtera brumata]
MDTGPKQTRHINPRLKANLLSVLTFGWLRPKSKILQQNPTTEYLKSNFRWTLETFKLGYSRDAIQKAWDREVEDSQEEGSDRKPSLWRVLFKVFGPEFVLYGLILAAMEFLIRLQQPMFLGLLLRYYSPVQELNSTSSQHTYLSRLFNYNDAKGTIAWGEAVFFAFGIIFCSAVNVMVQHPFMMGLMHMGMKMRVGVCSLIYRKALKVSLQNMSESSAGLVVNLMANDVNRFDTGPLFAHYLWIGPLETVIHFIKMTSYIRGVIMSFIMFTSRFGIFITVLLYVTYVNRITVENVFFLTCYYNITKQTMTLYFPQAVGQIAELKVAIQRIRDYLLSEECKLPPRQHPERFQVVDDNPKKRVTISEEPMQPSARIESRNRNDASTSQNNPKDLNEKEINRDEIVIKFENANSRWIKSTGKDDVQDLNLNINNGSLTCIIGAVGSGKSTLLHMVLSELPCSSGNMEVNGEVSYASQDPWLFVGSVRQNILFGQPFRKSRYMEVCKVCALERDISLFPHGDKTIVGERGVSLSGGQRARINLARAVYKEADIYLLDDPLSAVDTQVAKHIFERCIKRFIGNKTVILVTHQIQFIKFVDKVVIMDKGKILAEGAFEDLDDKELKIIQFMKEKVREVHEVDANSSLLSTSMLQPSTISLQRRHLSLIFDTSVADQKPEAESQTIGRVQGSVYKEYFVTGAACPFVALVFFLFILAQSCASACDYWISRWSHAEDAMTGDVTMDNVLWSEQGLDRNGFVLIFALITIAVVIVALIRAFTFFSLCMKSSIKLHDKMFEYISRSPMSFFHANPSGRILNRFSKDMGAVDELLPQAMIDCFQVNVALRMLGNALV